MPLLLGLMSANATDPTAPSRIEHLVNFPACGVGVPKSIRGAACFSTHWPLSLKENTPGFTTSMLGYTGFRLTWSYVQRRKLY